VVAERGVECLELLLVRLDCLLELHEFLLLSLPGLQEQRELRLMGLLERGESLLETKLELVHSSLLRLDPSAQFCDQRSLFRSLLFQPPQQRFDLREQFRLPHATALLTVEHAVGLSELRPNHGDPFLLPSKFRLETANPRQIGSW
jgi:hypothetical protein